MNNHEILLTLTFFALALVPVSFLGRYCFKVMEGQRNLLSAPPVLPERVCYHLFDVDLASEQDWKIYILALLASNPAGLVLLFSILMLQGSLPLNPQHPSGLKWTLAFNTVVSFVINTNRQAYSGKAPLSYFGQMVGLMVQNFVSAAVGLCVLVALARGISRHPTQQLGNFWVNLTRDTLYVLLSLCLLLALLLVWQGVSQTLFDYVRAITLQDTEQTIPPGSAASQTAIKQLGTDGDGFFGINSAHPFENLSAWSNLFEVASIILIPAALVFTLGHYVKDLRQSRATLSCMLLLFCLGLGSSLWAEYQPNLALAQLLVEQGAPMEGKESRLGTAANMLWVITTTAAPNGSVNVMYDSLSSLGGTLPLLNTMLSEVIFGGVGAGLYGMLLFVLIAVFLAGLMVGRMPEYLGKKLEAKEVRLLIFTLLVMLVGMLVLSAIAASLPGSAPAMTSPGPYGFSQLFYVYTSGSANNGSAFAGSGANTSFHNLMVGLTMLIGHFGYILPILVIVGSLAAKGASPVGPNSFPTHGLLLVSLLTVIILLVDGLTFLPILALDPIAEQLSLGF